MRPESSSPSKTFSSPRASRGVAGARQMPCGQSADRGTHRAPAAARFCHPAALEAWAQAPLTWSPSTCCQRPLRRLPRPGLPRTGRAVVTAGRPTPRKPGHERLHRRPARYRPASWGASCPLRSVTGLRTGCHSTPRKPVGSGNDPRTGMDASSIRPVWRPGIDYFARAPIGRSPSTGRSRSVSSHGAVQPHCDTFSAGKPHAKANLKTCLRPSVEW
jgi:hypothetical protein